MNIKKTLVEYSLQHLKILLETVERDFGLFFNYKGDIDDNMQAIHRAAMSNRNIAIGITTMLLNFNRTQMEFSNDEPFDDDELMRYRKRAINSIRVANYVTTQPHNNV